MSLSPRHQVWNIISGLTADGNATSRAPLKLWKGDEQALHALSMLAADILATFHAAGIEPTDIARTSVLYRLIAYLAKRPRMRLTRALRADVQLIASYLLQNPAHFATETSFADLLVMARAAHRVTRKQDPDGQPWLLARLVEILHAAIETGLVVTIPALAAVGFLIVPLLVVNPGRFVDASLEGWRTLLAPPACGGDCRIPIPPRGGRG